jgi:hypothetical protein
LNANKSLATEILQPITADIDPRAFPEQLAFAARRRWVILIMALLLAAGFLLRTSGLGAESLSEDELNKLQTVEEYRTNGLSGKNGEHPFLMKGLQTISVSTAERLSAAAGLNVPVEAALRFPLALFGTFSILMIFLLASALFGRSIGIVAAGLLALEPMAIGFDRIAKEDSLVVFFFLVTQFLWVRSQTKAQQEDPKWAWYAWASGAAFAGLMASKYYPHLLAISGGYYNVFKYVPTSRWNLHSKRWLIFFAIMGLTFLVLNPTIMLPDTWREMMKFSSENRIGHDSYEFMGALYPNKMTAWLAGVPWTFYYVFLAVKTSLPTLIFFLIGIPLVFRKKMGDGRFLIFFWAFMWFLPFTFLGGKFTRYFAFVTPLLCIIAAAGFCFLVKWLSTYIKSAGMRSAVQIGLLAALLAVPLANSFSFSPNFRLFNNTIGGGSRRSGEYFPHDEFYDGATAAIVSRISGSARAGAVIANETPGLFEYYAGKAGRADLRSASLSDASAMSKMEAGDMIVAARGRRYFSNTKYWEYLKTLVPAAEVDLGGVPAANIYLLDEVSAARVRELAGS